MHINQKLDSQSTPAAHVFYGTERGVIILV